MEIKELDLLVSNLFVKRAEIEKQKARLTELNKELTQQKSALVSALKELGRENFDSPAGKIFIQQKWTVRVPSNMEDKELLFNWLKEKGAFMQYATVNSNSLNSLYKSEIEAATDRGDLAFSIPGIGKPSLFEDLHVRTKGTKNDDTSSEE